MQLDEFIRNLELELKTERDSNWDDPTTARAIQCVYRAVARAKDATHAASEARSMEAYRLRNLPRCPICGTSPPCESDCR